MLEVYQDSKKQLDKSAKEISIVDYEKLYLSFVSAGAMDC